MAMVATDAATMLAEALEKMDDLISDDQLIMEGYKIQPLSSSPNERVVALAEELREILIKLTPSNRANLEVPKRTSEFLVDWLESMQHSSDGDQPAGIANGESSRAQIDRLENEKDSLILHVSVLTDQVEAQGEKMRELEFTLEELKIKAEDLEQNLEKEKSKSSAVVQENLELLAEISSLKLSASQLQESKKSDSENMMRDEFEAQLTEKDSDIELLKDHIEVLLDEQEILQKSLGDGRASIGLKTQLREKASEVNKLKLEVETLTVVVEDKDKKLKDLQQALHKFKRVEDMVVKAHQRKGSETSQTTATDPSLPDTSSINSSEGVLSPTSSTTAPESPTDSTTGGTTQLHAESYMQAVHNPVTPSLKTLHDKKHPVPKQRQGIRGSFGRGILRIKGPKSSSEPNISYVERSADGKNGSIPQNKGEALEATHGAVSPETQRKEKKSLGKTIGKALGKLRRSKSLSMTPEDRLTTEPADLRNYQRANAEQPEYGDQLELPFARWNPEMVTNWLDDLGLGCYTEQCRQNISCGEALLKASGIELDRKLGIKHPLHRKKLQLALQALVSDSPDIMGRLSNHWVLGWLEDIGLPHYKDTFSDACVDGRMLNYLTLDDLQQLKVNNVLHHVSIQRAIQCLRFYNFHPNCLKRYPIDESWQKGADVLLWTNGRVTEWLRLVDLAEYAPNLRGSGVHGALMILEARFTPETLAALLSIPPGKTLLRRHLASHFQSLVGPACYRTKEEAALDPGFSPIMPGAKQRVVKKSKSLGALRRRGKDSELDNYVCPMDLDIPTSLKPVVTQRTRRRPEDEFHRGRRESDEDDEVMNRTPTAIGAFSKELDSLTNMLDRDGHLIKNSGHQ